MTGILPATDLIQYVYKQSIYCAGKVITKIGQFPIGIRDEDYRTTWVMLSAYNPGGRIKHDNYNFRMMELLKLNLKKYYYIEGYGSFHNYSEPLLMVAADPCKMIVLARKFRQNAVVIVKKNRITKLKYLL